MRILYIQNKKPPQTDWKNECDKLRAKMEEQQSVFQKLMDEQKEAFTKRINDLENEIKILKVALKNAQGSSTSDSSS